jgi:hypothetical protein
LHEGNDLPEVRRLSAYSIHPTVYTLTCSCRQPPGSTAAMSAAMSKKKAPAATVDTSLSDRATRHERERAQRKLDLEGAAPEGDVGPARNAVGRCGNATNSSII